MIKAIGKGLRYGWFFLFGLSLLGDLPGYAHWLIAIWTLAAFWAWVTNDFELVTS